MKNALPLFVAALAFASGYTCAQTPGEELFRSIENGDFTGFSRLVDAGVPLAAKNGLGESPLTVPAKKADPEMPRARTAAKPDPRALTPNRAAARPPATV